MDSVTLRVTMDAETHRMFRAFGAMLERRTGYKDASDDQIIMALVHGAYAAMRQKREPEAAT